MWLRPVEQRVTVFHENLVIATVRSIVRLTALPQLQLFAFYYRSSGTQHLEGKGSIRTFAARFTNDG